MDPNDPIEAEEVFDELLLIANQQIKALQNTINYHKNEYNELTLQKQKWIMYVEQLTRTKHLIPDQPEECPTQKLH